MEQGPQLPSARGKFPISKAQGNHHPLLPLGFTNLPLHPSVWGTKAEAVERVVTCWNASQLHLPLDSPLKETGTCDGMDFIPMCGCEDARGE